MSVLVDTNLLSRIADPHHPHNPVAAESVKRLLAGGERLHVVPQNAYEFWVVATRPIAQNGLGMSTREANAKLDELLLVLELLPDTPAVFPEWRRLVAEWIARASPHTTPASWRQCPSTTWEAFSPSILATSCGTGGSPS